MTYSVEVTMPKSPLETVLLGLELLAAEHFLETMELHVKQNDIDYARWHSLVLRCMGLCFVTGAA